MKLASTKAYGDCTGPLGFRMPSRTARIVESALKGLPAEVRGRFKTAIAGQEVDGYARRWIAPKAVDVDGEARTDVSIITADGVDHEGDVVLPGGIDFTVFRQNMVVPYCHDYESLPVGRCLWVKETAVGRGRGWKAATKYTERPTTHPAAAEWFPDTVFSFVQAEDLRGKSIGFIPLSVRKATADEVKANPAWKGADVIDRCLMLEYSVCSIPCQPSSLVQSVAKMAKGGLAVPRSFLASHGVVLPDDVKTVADVERGEAAATGTIPAGMTAAVAFKGLPAPATDADGNAKPLAATYEQYIQTGNTLAPIGAADLTTAAPANAYRVELNWMTGQPSFAAFAPETDELLRFKSSVAEDVLAEIDRFWGLKSRYDALGLLHNRGMILYGPPGTGKTSVLHQTAEMIVGRGDVVLYGKSIDAVAAGLAAFREVEPDRKAVVVLEDADEFVGYQERAFLQLLDGEKSVDGVLYLLTTNYIGAFPPRLLRPGRVDKKVFVGPPDLDARAAYLTAKVVATGVGTAEEVARLAAETDGFSFGDLRELVVAVYALDESADDAVARLKGAGGRLKAVDEAGRSEAVKRFKLVAGKRMTAWREEAALLAKAEADGASEGDAGGGGYTTAADTTPMPECPKCGTAEHMTAMTGDDVGVAAAGADYRCAGCGTEYDRDDDGGMVERAVKAAPEAQKKTAAPPPSAAPPAPEPSPVPKSFVRPETIAAARAAKLAEAKRVAVEKAKAAAVDEIARMLGTP